MGGVSRGVGYQEADGVDRGGPQKRPLWREERDWELPGNGRADGWHSELLDNLRDHYQERNRLA